MAKHTMTMWAQTLMYRLRQTRQQLGFVAPLSSGDQAEVATLLPPSALPLFRTMSNADQQHSVRVYRGLLARGCRDNDLLVAALLHDVGKAEGRVPFWTRPAIVLGKVLVPHRLSMLMLSPARLQEKHVPRWQQWRRSLSYAWWHAEVGAELAEQAGVPERTVLYIRTHHQPHGPARALHIVDEVS